MFSQRYAEKINPASNLQDLFRNLYNVYAVALFPSGSLAHDEPDGVLLGQHGLRPLAAQELDGGLGLRVEQGLADGLLQVEIVAPSLQVDGDVGLRAILLQQRHLLAERIGQKPGHDVGTMYVIVRVVLTAVGHAGLLAGQEPHVQFLRSLGAKSLLEFMGDAVGIDEVAIHALGHVARGYVRSFSSSSFSGTLTKKLRRTTQFISTGMPPCSRVSRTNLARL